MSEISEMFNMQYAPHRLELIHRAMKRDEIDALVITRAKDVLYATGYSTPTDTSPSGCIIVDGEPPLLLISESQRAAINTEHITTRLSLFKDDYTDTRNPYRNRTFLDQVVGIINEYGKGSGMIGIQQEWFSVKAFDHLKSKIPEAGFKDFSQTILKLRQIKDAAEIDTITKAVRLAEIGIRTALELISPGKTGHEISVEIESAIRRAGSHLRGTRAAVLSGATARFPFSQPSLDRISSNTPVVIDITVNESNYYANISRTLHPGTPSESQRKLFESGILISETLEENMMPDALVSDVAELVIKRIEGDYGIETFSQPLGSSIGLDLLEPPYIHPGNKTILREGMTFSVHPSCYLKEVGSIRIADVYLITSTGCKNLSSIARETM
ncbi:MAG: M24 family metallopeptidase [Candidatus Thorarchaeota archaeon]